MRRVLVASGWLLLLVLVFLIARKVPADARARLAGARPLPIAGGCAVYALAYVARGARLNFLLPREERIPVTRAVSLSAATTFLLQVIPFRGGEVATWAAFRRELGVTWTRAAAIFALVKVVDSATLLLLGLAGAAVLSLRSGSQTIGTATAILVAAGAVGLLLLPRIGATLARSLVQRLPPGSKRRATALEIAQGLDVARAQPGLFLSAIVLALAFLAVHLTALYLMLGGLGIDTSIAGLAFASLTSVLTASVIPSPAGSFGPMESGFAAGLALDGVPLPLGALAGAAVHLLTTLIAGVIGIPFLVRTARTERTVRTERGKKLGDSEG
ncbi:MAG: lysylphosphatidylglycerol synthase transmembrane domain-containing protein [Thermoanaerobaculia bacterium]